MPIRESSPGIQPPPEATIASAERLLAMLGALESGRITELGRQMLSLPVHPRIARLLIAAAEHGLLHEGAAIAAILSEKDFLPDDVPAQRGSSDLARADAVSRSTRSAVGRARAR